MTSSSGELPPDPTPPVEILWRGDVAEDVIVRADWSELLSPPELLVLVRDLVNEHLGGGSGGRDWRFDLSLANVALKDLREFTAQLADARAEAKAQPSTTRDVTTLHFRAVWQDATMLELTGDDAWAQAPLPVIGKDIAEAIAVPEMPAVKTVARDRLLKFMESGD